ncbi:PREDICTED: pentatricopeptide repeat-containing protein At1g80270, mitochondrial-like [Nelumbo nucifera]|uniref:Pentatricopeptide repeat-containing protein At1g80270, mitochondrial-like n=1 Tax=Nelumbo nucifera TaxID=4432 RepID=A0A1U8B6E0_NELNU|nr:PREDICTED: pentatricopeptide repeat-containing protein At1g80270, mitochondrial-like [Nelumbo nucifera]
MMWALRRAAHPLRSQGFRGGVSRACARFVIVSDDVEHSVGVCESTQFVPGKSIPLERFHHTSYLNARFSLGNCSLSSQAGTKSSGEEDEFSELEAPVSTGEIAEDAVGEDIDEELGSEPELSGDDVEENLGDVSHDEPEELDTDIGDEKESLKKKGYSELFKVIMDAPGLSIHGTLDKWVEEGNELSRSEIWLALHNLRKRQFYGRALQLMEWLERNKHLDYVERDYASRVDLIAKVHGLNKAEKYIESIPESFRGEVIYRTLLANCVGAGNMMKANAVFNKMKDLKFPITAFSCNQLLLLYKRLDKKKIADVLLLMEKENVQPTLFTYRLLIDAKGQSNDILGLDQLVETMKADGIEPDNQTQATIARHYADAGLNEKAEEVLKEMERGDVKENRSAFKFILPIYAALGKADEVSRVWKVCEQDPWFEECLAAISAWGKLGKIEEAESVFEMMTKKWKKVHRRCYSLLLKVYADHKMLAKGKELAKRMIDSGCRIDALTWDALVKLCVEAGEVEKADSILQKATQQFKTRPLFSSFMVVLDQYAKRGDVHNAEKILHRLRQSGYLNRIPQYHTLLQAYINAKAPAYGFRERLKADNIFPDKAMAAMLAQVDPFRKTAISDLLD